MKNQNSRYLPVYKKMFSFLYEKCAKRSFLHFILISEHKFYLLRITDYRLKIYIYLYKNTWADLTGVVCDKLNNTSRFTVSLNYIQL